MRVRFFTLGCKVNQYESQALRTLFLKAGYEALETGKAHIYIVNSCTVTSQADKKTRQLLNRLRKENPDAVIVLTGCLPQASSAISPEVVSADIVTGTRERADLVRLVDNYLETRRPLRAVSDYSAGQAYEALNVDRFDHRFQRAYIKIEDGCDRACAYCIIPTARGPVRSRPLEEIKLEADRLLCEGYRELVLTGINLSRYGFDTGHSLVEAVQLTAACSGDFRVRLGSVEPDLLSEADYLALSKIDKLCPHFHLALQSGCNRTLSRMNRHYTAQKVLSTVETIHRLFSNPSITADFIVGFPGETEDEFFETLRFVSALPLMRAHIFEFSLRAGTPAADMADQVLPAVKKERAKRLKESCDIQAQLFSGTQLGKTVRVLCEAKGGGYTDNYLYVSYSPQPFDHGRFIEVLLTDKNAAGCTGMPVTKLSKEN